jgi:hypothetical protein
MFVSSDTQLHRYRIQKMLVENIADEDGFKPMKTTLNYGCLYDH